MDETRFDAVLTQSAAPSTLAWRHQQLNGLSPEYTGFWRRFVASSIDDYLVGLVHGVVGFILNSILDSVLDPDAFANSPWLGLSVWFAAFGVSFVVIDWLYYAGQERSSRQATLGKRALGIAVTDLAGGRISFGRATGRYFAHYVSLLTLFVGFLIQPFTNKRQALHDLMTGTLVVRT